nr:hypothetical protein [Spirochaetota bacterium]
MRLKIVYFIFLCLLLSSCVSVNDEIRNPLNQDEFIRDAVYDLRIIKTDETSIYESKKENSCKLIIYIEGSGLNSVLGERKNGIWRSFQFSYYVYNFFKDKCNIIIPEKLKMRVGENYESDKETVSLYTVENMFESYRKSVDFYLDEHDFSTVILFGVSEGGLLIPKIYDSLKNREKISKIVVWGSGGLSQYECFKILGNTKI